MRSKLVHALVFALGALFSPSLSAQLPPEEVASALRPHTQDMTPYKTADLSIYGDTSLAVKKMDIPFTSVPSLNFSDEQMAKAISDDFIRQLIGLPPWVQIPYPLQVSSLISNPDALGSSPNPRAIDLKFWYEVISGVITIAQYVLPYVNNVDHRCYLFFSPCEADYKLTVTVPGDWLIRPRSIVTFQSPDLMLGSIITTVPYERENSSDRTETITVHANRGICAVRVSIGSFSSHFHNAGTLNGTTLDNPTTVNSTIRDIPIAYKREDLYGYLPTVGSSNIVPFTYVCTQSPLIRDGIMTATPLYGKTLGIEAIPPNTVQVVYATGDEDILPEGGTYYYTYMDAEEYHEPTLSGDTAYFYFHRNANVTKTVTVKIRIRPVQEYPIRD